ncbi:hypothetical protein A1O7_04401 [Cladophialophora yegresii CBS 114405]|uniref:Uncharacterized protein n=1 Tax=Cladophialophora yegresii CBS 114405 TaxID=1182544 RepID=W9WPB5_9EURO|nr:uncharacterized protein A1O7_04401 [Cladophialophora yegresii CBS 114405]EXJ60249.1 hypothetical protein A1O7_04401 [Cladophialophora yegresii CBS 114405]
MAQTMKEKELSSSPLAAQTPPEGSSAGGSSIYDDMDPFVDERLHGEDPSLRRGRYDERGFLIGFENSTAYTQPRPAPSPTKGRNPVLTAACSPPSTPPNEPLPLLPLHQPLIAVPYQSTLPWNSEPPSILPTTPFKLSEAYRNRCLNQCLGRKSTSRKGRYNLQGYWLSRRTLRGFGQQEQESGLQMAVVRETEQSSPSNDSGRSQPLWSRVRDSVRRSNTLTRLSLSNSFQELARTAERIGYQPPF